MCYEWADHGILWRNMLPLYKNKEAQETIMPVRTVGLRICKTE